MSRTDQFLNEVFLGNKSAEEVPKLTQEGEFFEFGEHEPLDLEGGAQFADFMEAYVREMDERISRLAHLSLESEGMEGLAYQKRGLTFDEYRRFLGTKLEEVHQKEKPLTKEEFFSSKGWSLRSTAFTTPKPRKPTLAEMPGYDREDKEERLKRALTAWEVQVERWQKENASSKDQVQQVTQSRATEYRQYLRAFNETSVPDYIKRDPAFAFIATQSDFRAFLSSNPPTMAGYIRFLDKAAGSIPILRKWYEKRFCFIPASVLKGHSYLTGSTGSGKTELLKYTIHQVLKSRKGSKYPRSIIVIEPHGKFCKELARHKDFPREETVFFNTELDGRTIEDGRQLPGYNLFDFPHQDEASIDSYCQSLANAFQELTGDFTPYMEVIAKNCFQVLIRREGATLEDFVRMLDNEQNGKYISAGERIPQTREFFKTQFHQRHFDPTKNSLRTRTQSFLTNSIFRRVVAQEKSSFDIEEIANTGKIGLFSMRGLGEDGGKVLGRLLMARLRFTAFARPEPELSRPETFIFMDEFQNYVGRSIKTVLTEGRQFKIYLTLASQTIGQDMDTQLLDAMMSCTNTKLVGNNDRRIYKKVEGSLNVSTDELESLSLGVFYFRSKMLSKQRRAFKIYVPGWYVDTKGHISEDAWRAFKQAQIDAFYRDGTQIEKPERRKRKPGLNTEPHPEGMAFDRF